MSDSPFNLNLSERDFTKTNPMLLLTNNVSAWIKSLAGRVAINQRVYVIDKTSGEMYETYQVGNINVEKRFAQVTSKGIQYLDSLSVFEERRMNFQGLHMTVMVGQQNPYNLIEPNYQEIAPFHENNSTYDVTDITIGKFRQVLETMAARMNFTFREYLRKDGWWASAITDENGERSFIMLCY